MKNNKVNVNGLAGRISTCYKENGTFLEGIKEYSIYEEFKIWFGDSVNSQLRELKLLKNNHYFLLFSSFSEAGNVFDNPSELFSIETLNNQINISYYRNFLLIEILFFLGLSEKIIADTNLGNSYLLVPRIQRFLGSSDFEKNKGIKRKRKFELENQINEMWIKTQEGSEEVIRIKDLVFQSYKFIEN